MSRPLRINLHNGIYHVMSRGVAKRTIFETDADRRRFLLGLRDAMRRHEVVCVAYCLMGNHYHGLLQTPKANLSDCMRDLNGDYARGFNAEHGRVGPLLTHRFKGQLVQDNAYLLAAARYIALNPVRGSLVRRPEDWPWSSYAALHADDRSRLTDERTLFAVLSADEDTARREFIALVAEGGGLPPYTPRKAIAGDQEFIDRHSPCTPPAAPVVRQAWKEARPPLAELFGRVSETEFLRRARFDYRYTVREIAAALGCSPSTVTRRLRDLRDRGELLDA